MNQDSSGASDNGTTEGAQTAEEKLRAILASRKSQLMQKLGDYAIAEDLVLLDGEWISSKRVVTEFRRLRWRGRLIFLELSFLILALLITALGILVLLTYLVGRA